MYTANSWLRRRLRGLLRRRRSGAWKRIDCMARYGLYDPATEHVKGAMPPDALALYLASSAGGKRLGATKRRRLPKEPPSPGLAGLEPKAGLAQAAAEAALAAADPRNK